ncbi:MAG: YaeQ family protein [Gammaproteobacteria bacterium]|nr:YaeQ family protein [Gammaproteobacteria bacterium]
MALKSTIFKAELQITDMDRNYYQNHTLTIARHPSETEQRMMVRLLAFGLHASDDLVFTKGLSTNDEPDLWQISLNGEIQVWIDLGQPDEKRIRKACGRAKHVFIYTYQQRSAVLWWEQIKNKLDRFDNLSVINIPDDSVQILAKLAQRNMQLQVSIQDGLCWFANDDQTVQIDQTIWK